MHKLHKLSKIAITTGSLLLLWAAVFSFGMSVPAHAQDINLGTNFVTNEIDFATGDPRVAVLKLVRLALAFIGIIAVIIIIYAGFLWMTSGGNENKIEQAKKTLVNAVIGLAIILSSFIIVSFVIGRLGGSLHGGGGGPGAGRGMGFVGGGIGAIGNCGIESVYPEPGQRDVPRNSGIIVTFSEEVDPASVISGGTIIADGRIRIYKSADDGDLASNWITDVAVSTNDSRTYVFSPGEYLGSPSENIWYTVYLSNDIRKLNEPEGIFSDCGFNKDYKWQFETSNRVDLIPPFVQSVFPSPDSDRDTSITTGALAAQGTITVVVQPTVSALAVFGAPAGSPSAELSGENDNYDQSGTFRVAIAADGLTARLQNVTTGALSGSAQTNSGSVTFPGLFTLSLTNYPSDDFVAGNSWDISVTAAVSGDALTVGSITYPFVTGAPSGNQIQLGANTGATAANIAASLAANPAVFGAVAGNVVTVTARTAGSAGNNILFRSNSAALVLNPSSNHLEGGVNSGVIATVVGLRDQPRNAVVQVNFSEAVNPLTVSGPAADLAGFIRVINADTGARLDGNFLLSNQYRTVEFVSDNLCGVNGCGERIYCLPENAQIRVELTAAALEGCINCQAKTPYSDCIGGHCYDSASNENYPLAASPLNGIVDMALNSLDGNSDGDADGPGVFYDLNIAAGAGDDFRWSFFTSGIIDLNPPVITGIDPAHTDVNVSLSDPVIMDFNKLMMSDSLRTGGVLIFDGKSNVKHKRINLFNFSNQPTGYWITKSDIDNDGDGVADITSAELRHTMFADAVSYRAQVGSGVKDIYQNCFKPVSGPGCIGTAINPSCCPSGVIGGPLTNTSVLSGSGNCP